MYQPVENIPPIIDSYFPATRTATYSFLAALPLLIIYEVLILFVNLGRSSGIRISSDLWLKQVLYQFGVSSHLAIGLVVLTIGVVIFIVDRAKAVPIRRGYFGGMIVESAIYAFLLALLISNIVGMIFSYSASVYPLSSPDSGSLFTHLALSIGAGLYEELVFRVILVSGLFALLKLVVKQAITGYILAALIAAFLFSLVHYIGAYGDAFTLASFTFRFLFGLALNVLFIVRGFGIAAWTHALYDVMVFTVFS